MKILEKILNWFENLDLEKCPNCKTQMTCYGSEPWGVFTYECETCKYSYDPNNGR